MAQMTEEQREDLECYVWDAYKDAHGIRPRWMNFKAMSDDALTAFADQLSEEVEEAINREREAEAEFLAQYEASVAKLMREQGIDRHTAMRWLFDADNVETDFYQDVEHFFWKLGVSFTKARELFDEYHGKKAA